eukprot:4921517-Prymnesium_polylepis.1
MGARVAGFHAAARVRWRGTVRVTAHLVDGLTVGVLGAHQHAHTPLATAAVSGGGRERDVGVDVDRQARDASHTI